MLKQRSQRSANIRTSAVQERSDIGDRVIVDARQHVGDHANRAKGVAPLWRSNCDISGY